MSLGKLSALTLRDLGLALVCAFGFVLLYCWQIAPTVGVGLVVVGKALGLSLDDSVRQAHAGHQVEITCTALPPDDRALERLLRDLPGVWGIRIKRSTQTPRSQGETFHLLAYYRGPQGLARPEIPWEQLGYVPGKPTPWIWWSAIAPEVSFNPTPHQLRFLCVASLQGGFLIVGLWRVWRGRKLATPEPVREENALLAGLGMGFALGAFYWAADQALLHLVGPPAALSRSWIHTPSEGWNVPLIDMPYFWRPVEPHALLLGILAGTVLLFPLAQVTFFLGGVLRTWIAGGWPRAGLVVTVVLSALLTLDLPFLLAALVLDCALTWLYLRTRSLFATLVALILLSVVILGVNFGAVPGFDHPTNLLAGKWEVADSPEARNAIPLEAQPLHFVRGGAVRLHGPRAPLTTSNVSWSPSHYQWLDRDRLRIVWNRFSLDPKTRTARSTYEAVDYRVEVEYRELTLTRLSDGKVLRYQRASP